MRPHPIAADQFNGLNVPPAHPRQNFAALLLVQRPSEGQRALVQTREVARQKKCADILRQISVAVQSYVSDSNHFCPRRCSPANPHDLQPGTTAKTACGC